MSFLDKLGGVGSAISSKGQEAANKAKEMSGVSSLKSKISTAESNIRAAYIELGEKIFAENPDWLADNYPEILSKVVDFHNDIEQYNKEIEDLKQATADANAKIQEEQKIKQAMAAKIAAEKAAAKAAAAEEAAHRAAEAAAQSTDTSSNSTGE